MSVIRDIIRWCLCNATFVAAIVALIVPFIMNHFEKCQQKVKQKDDCFRALLCNYYAVKPVVNGFVDCHAYGESSYLDFRNMIMVNFSCYMAFRAIFYSKAYQKLFDDADGWIKEISNKTVNFSEPRFTGWVTFGKLLDSELKLLNAIHNKKFRSILFYDLPFSGVEESEVK